MSLDLPADAHSPRRHSSAGQAAARPDEGPSLEQVRQVLLARLRERGVTGEDLEDLGTEALRRCLTAFRGAPGAAGARVEDTRKYALAVADSVFTDHLRRTRPNWYRLKRRLLYLLDTPAGAGLFARWRPPVGRGTHWLAGFARWRGRSFHATPRYRSLLADPAGFTGEALGAREPAEVPLPELLAHLFRWLGTPLEVDHLTEQVAALQRIADAEALSLDELAQEMGERLPAADDVAGAVIAAMAGEERRAHLCREIGALPERQRAALLLGMSGDELLALSGTLSTAAALLDLPPAELAGLWRVLPLPDRAIGERLGATPVQVSNLRKCARERLARRITREER